MGQYFLTVNLTKGEFIDPHELGLGLKALEQVGDFRATTGDILLMLLATNAGRGGGDFALPNDAPYPDYSSVATPEERERLRQEWSDAYHAAMEAARGEVYGRWAGDQIAFVGDYTEDDDIPQAPRAGLLYQACRLWTDYRKKGMPDVEDFLNEYYDTGRSSSTDPEQLERWKEEGRYILTQLHFVDISASLYPYIELNFGVRIDATSKGWKERLSA